MLYDNGDARSSLLVYPAGRQDSEYTISLKAVNIEPSAFSGNKYLKRVKMPGALKTIDFNAFSDCASLETVVIPRSVIYVGTGAFNSCPKLSIFAEIEEPSGGWIRDWNIDSQGVYFGGNWYYENGIPRGK